MSTFEVSEAALIACGWEFDPDSTEDAATDPRVIMPAEGKGRWIFKGPVNGYDEWLDGRLSAIGAKHLEPLLAIPEPYKP